MLQETVHLEIEHIRRQLIEKYRAEKIILFGSAVQGPFTDDSDLDFLVIKRNIPHYGKDRLLELDRMIQYSIPTDMLVYSPEEVASLLAMGDPFLKSIMKHGKVLHG